MSITTYAELKTAAANWLARADMSAHLDDLIMVAEKYIFRRVRSKELESDLSVTITDGVGDVPADFVELKYSHMSGNNSATLEARPAHWMTYRYPIGSAAGTPRYIAIENSKFKVAPKGSGTLNGIYYKRPAPLSVGSVNELFTNNPDLYLFATLAEAKVFLLDDARVAKWEQKRNEIIAQIKAEHRASKYSSNMAVRAA